jgi:SAM-dependent methyltransferase
LTRFSDDKHIKNLLEYGTYPKIHDDIFYLSKFIEADNVLDLGCCTGLLSNRLANIYENVIGIEANKSFLNKAIKKDNIFYFNIKINNSTLDKVKDIIHKYNIDTIFARRVFPELYTTGGTELLNNLSTLFFTSRINYIVLEGRKPVKNATNPYNTLDREIEIFKKHYTEYIRYKNCSILKINKHETE